MLSKANRLTVADISLLSSGRSVFGVFLSIRFIKSEKLKFSVSVSKKIAARAVDRNRIRRRLYSVIEKLPKKIENPFFIMINAKKECLTTPYQEIIKDLQVLFERAGILA